MWRAPWTTRALGFGPRPEHSRVKSGPELNLFFHDAFGPRIDAGTEFMAALGLGADFQPRVLRVLAEGSKDRIEIHFEDVRAVAKMPGVEWIVLIHNHPSGNSAPSEEDVYLTDKVALWLFRERNALLWDHIITTANVNTHYSFRADRKIRMREDTAEALRAALRAEGGPR